VGEARRYDARQEGEVGNFVTIYRLSSLSSTSFRVYSQKNGCSSCMNLQ
jgi:hypothetical protein